MMPAINATPKDKMRPYATETQLNELRSLRLQCGVTFVQLQELTGYHEIHLIKVFSGSRKLTIPAYRLMKSVLSQCKVKESH